MKDEIVYVLTKEAPEFQCRLGKFPSTNVKFNKRNIIIIPGWLSAIDNFTPMAQALQKYSNAIIYEPRGFGKTITTHKKGHFSPEEYNKELATVINHLDLKDQEFIILGSCSGGSQAFHYLLEGDGPKPSTLLVFHPQEFYGTPFWLPILGWVPTFIMKFIQKLIIVLYRFYLKVRGTGESPNVTWAAERLKKNDDWSLRRFILEFIIKYDIRNRQKEIAIPIQMFVAEKDHFVDPERSQKFIHHKESEIISLKDTLHRVHVGKEDEIALKIDQFLKKLSK